MSTQYSENSVFFLGTPARHVAAAKIKGLNKNKNSVKTFQNLHLSSEDQELGGVPGAFQFPIDQP